MFNLNINDSKTGERLLVISSHVLPVAGSEIQIRKTVYDVTKVVFLVNTDDSGLFADCLSYHVLVRDRSKCGDVLL